MNLRNRFLWLAPLTLLLSCGQDISITESSHCDGALQNSEDTVDSPYDQDGDGYFDGSNADCVATYSAQRLDCDDLNPNVNPGLDEILCDGFDNDCDDSTLDGEDFDGDGFTACEEEDCDDSNPDVFPGNAETPCNGIDDDCNPVSLDDADEDNDGWTVCDQDCDDDEPLKNPGMDEVCEDELDNDCNGEVDEACEDDWNGTWFLDKNISYSCAFGYVELAFSTVDITHSNTNLLIEGEGTKGQPGKTSGTLTGWDFETQRQVTGGCTETYTFEGSFVNQDQFEGVFIARYTGSGNNCADCKTRNWPIVGTR
ncbi:MAG: putative metal-binding motif-containing protein [Myxococcota bacterium]|nr:putative metal-binding motif-containing protein [Myxococcota bacterium]